MTRFDYSNLESTAKRLIDRFGRDAVLIKKGTPADGATLYDAPPADTESDIILCETRFSLMNRDGTLIKNGDKRWLISTEGLAPELEDKVQLDGTKYELINVDPLNPGGTVLLYEVQGRK